MVILACVDNQFGMLFNHRRQSSDQVVIDKIIQISTGKCLWMNDYSSFLFPKSVSICINKNFLELATSGDFCFVESPEFEQYLHHIDKIVLFQWDRRYPADSYFPVSILKRGWRLMESTDFKGSSHDRITMKVYEQ